MPATAFPQHDADAAPVVVPALQHWEPAPGTLALRDGFTVVWNDVALADTARTLMAEIAELAGLSGSAGGAVRSAAAPAFGAIRPVDTAGTAAGAIELVLDPALDLGAAPATAAGEGYVLEVGDGVVLKARTATGVYWATRSLLQMLLAPEGLARGTAVDWPNYPVRGFMLDVGRRFSRPEYLADLVRFMSWHKLNTFMVHLNDNEIAKDTGRNWSEAQSAFRLESENPALAGLVATDGSYSRAEWDTLEDLAARHHVTLVPEIDVPAHSRSLIAWRPELGLNGGDSDMLDLSKQETVELVKELFTEFVPWFRSPMVNFGADEYSKDHHSEYRDFFNVISAHLQDLGKAPVAWGSLTAMANGAPNPGEGFDRTPIICSWNNDWYSGRAATADGYKVINTNDVLLYIVPFADYYHGGPLDAEALFTSWEPHVFGEDQDLEPGHPQLLGAASALWNDLVLRDYDEHTMHAMIEPAFGVLAQKMWRGPVPGMDFEVFTQGAQTVSAWPGRTFVK
ncbi:hypothetical protein ART_3619 [Arthrobacter sp. PAMC 25486]|uniref:family 20 glycosylhydrolase n=1 Tax=Arthrobacter sp. PAMC 25486 TaxID=1494608 RepID=UPI000535FCBA|nr:family 20 glycosylhydrolase [Arthrobacter sp. PAMC 25486]AIY03218.1 hypothetical protein ART_3619 [Arthrobacter sp. PAMC 25486]